MHDPLPLFVLEPPYTAVRRLIDGAPALGSILLMDAPACAPASLRDQVRVALTLAPWCPVCVLADRRIGGRGIRRHPRTCAVVAPETQADPLAAILWAVDTRPRPTPSALVEWIVRRTKINSLGRTLSDLFSRPVMSRAEVQSLPWSMREQLTQLGSLGPVEWQLTAWLARCASDRRDVERFLAGRGVGPADVRDQLEGMLGVSESDFRQVHGWEWILEAALQRAGFMEARCASNGRGLPAQTLAAGSVTAPPVFATRVAARYRATA